MPPLKTQISMGESCMAQRRRTLNKNIPTVGGKYIAPLSEHWLQPRTPKFNVGSVCMSSARNRFYFCKPGGWLRTPSTLNFGGEGYPVHIMNVEQYLFLLLVFLLTFFNIPLTRSPYLVFPIFCPSLGRSVPAFLVFYPGVGPPALCFPIFYPICYILSIFYPIYYPIF